jgi:hypothetical protein
MFLLKIKTKTSAGVFAAGWRVPIAVRAAAAGRARFVVFAARHSLDEVKQKQNKKKNTKLPGAADISFTVATGHATQRVLPTQIQSKTTHRRPFIFCCCCSKFASIFFLFV